MRKITKRRVKRYIGYILFLIKFFSCKLIYFLLPLNMKKYYDNAWIISERGDDARDNGFFFFRYVRNKYPQKKIFYIIKKNSPDYPKVAELGNVVYHGGFRHYMFTVSKCLKISSHIFGYTPNYNFFIRFNPKYNLLNGKKVCLDHGVIKDLIEGFKYKNTKLDLMIAASLPEYNYLISDEYGYTPINCSYTGLARFDELFEKDTENIVLLMPTWRLYYYDISSDKEFLETEYYKTYDKVINDEFIHEVLLYYSYRLIFYPHYEMQRFIQCFHSKWENVTIASFNDYDVHELLMKSKLLITDYSSVFFDFAYMFKPIICYQFDHEEYRKHHYTKGYFSHVRDGFGEVVYDISDLKSKLVNALSSNCKMEPEYVNRVKKFFVKRDANNCQRIYEAIVRVEENE